MLGVFLFKKKKKTSVIHVFLFFFKIYFIYLFLAMLGLCWYLWAFSSCGEQGLLSRCGAQASHHGGFSCYGAQA